MHTGGYGAPFVFFEQIYFSLMCVQKNIFSHTCVYVNFRFRTIVHVNLQRASENYFFLRSLAELIEVNIFYFSVYGHFSVLRHKIGRLFSFSEDYF